MPEGLFAEACTKDPEEAFNENLARHLRFSDAPVRKTNGDFHYAEALLRHSICQFDLEGVALGLNGVEVDIAQHGTAVTTKSSRAVMDWNTEHEASKDIATTTNKTA